MTPEISYQLKRTRRRRSIMLRIDPTGTVTVLAPKYALKYSIERYVRDQADWIREKLNKFEALKKQHPSKEFIHGEHFLVWGIETPLAIHRNPAVTHSSCKLIDGQLQVTIPEDAPTPPLAKEALRDWYGHQTEDRLREMVSAWAERMAVVPGSIKVANQRKRWASCSPQGHLRFNWRLSMMPVTILEYVVVHELAHIHAHDHSKRFWSIVQSALPDFKSRRTWLRKNGAPLGLDYNEV